MRPAIVVMTEGHGDYSGVLRFDGCVLINYRC
jgi:hypothetical protein